MRENKVLMVFFDTKQTPPKLKQKPENSLLVFLRVTLCPPCSQWFKTWVLYAAEFYDYFLLFLCIHVLKTVTHLKPRLSYADPNARHQ